MKHPNWRTTATLALVIVFVASLAQAKINKERGNIVSTDWRNMEMEITHAPSGHLGTWRVKRDARVRFTDKKSEFPDPKLSDLRAPMYIHYMFEAGTNLIDDIEVIEVGYEPSAGGPGVTVEALITNLDADIGQVEVDLGAGPQTFRVEDSEQLTSLSRGERVTLLIETLASGQEVVTQIEPLLNASSTVTRTAVVTNLDAAVGHIEVQFDDNNPNTFRVEPKRELDALRRGQRVEIRIETLATGEQVVTQITPRL